MRPDTPQHYEYILVENIKGNANRMLNVSPWTQFFDLKGEKDIKSHEPTILHSVISNWIALTLQLLKVPNNMNFSTSLLKI